jgi:hypothetical protein
MIVWWLPTCEDETAITGTQGRKCRCERMWHCQLGLLIQKELLGHPVGGGIHCSSMALTSGRAEAMPDTYQSNG